MVISTAKALEIGPALSEFTAAPVAPAPSALRARRGVRVDWYLLGVLLLILASGAACFYRLAWAMQS